MADFFGNLKENLESIGKVISEKADVVGKKTGEVVDAVAKKTEQTVEAQKVKSQIRTMERNNERDYQDIGKMIYERYKKGETVDEQYVELCEAIKAREQEIKKRREEVAELKGLDVCPKCKAHVETDASFCPKCGAKISDEPEFEEE